MSCFDKCYCFGWQQVDSMFDVVEGEPNHVRLACVVPITQIQLFCGRWVPFYPDDRSFQVGEKRNGSHERLRNGLLGCESCPTTASWQNRNH